MHLQPAFSCIIKYVTHSANIAIQTFPLEYLFARYAVISSPGVPSRSTDTWNIYYLVRVVQSHTPTYPQADDTLPRTIWEVMHGRQAAPEPQKGKTVFVYDYSTVLIAG